jgi:hypothetical protein
MNMTPSSSLVGLSGENPSSRVAGIAPAPLLLGEQQAEYATLIARIVAVAQPRDAIEDLLTRDVIDLSWEILRLRRIKAGILKASMSDGVREVLDGLVVRMKRLRPSTFGQAIEMIHAVKDSSV